MTDTPPTGSPKLLPCPFCGGEATMRGFYTPEVWVCCDSMWCEASTKAGAEHKAIAAWNRRALTPPTDDEREGLARAMRPILFRGFGDDKAGPALQYAREVVLKDAIAALAYLAPIRAAAEAAAYQRGVADERALVVWWLRNDPDAHYKPYDAIERAEHTKGDEG